MLVGCDGVEQISIDEIQAVEGATVLREGDDIDELLIKNINQDAQLRSKLGIDGEIDQKAYRLNPDISWDNVKKHYNSVMENLGWNRGLERSDDHIMSNIIDRVNETNQLFQTATWSTSAQSLTIIRIIDPVNEENVFLIVSLTSESVNSETIPESE